MRKLLLTNFQAPGDIVMLTAAVRDLHRCYPGQFLTDVRTSCPELWENNPYLTPLDPDDPEVQVVRCQYPVVHQSGQRPIHFLHGFVEYLNEQLQLQIRPTAFKGDIHLSPAEKATPSPVAEKTGMDLPYWIIVAGGKYDFTIKWWHFRRWQAVVDHFQDQLLFVQAGEKHHYHPALRGSLSFIGKTGLREIIRLVYHAQGVLCPVTLMMHLAAAVECPAELGPSRPCIVVAGGRESPHWEAYPTHQFLHTVGMLPCCLEGGCWRARSVPLGDGDEKDQPKHLCLDVVANLPRCMHEIRPEMVIRPLELYLSGRALPCLSAAQARATKPFLRQAVPWVGVESHRPAVAPCDGAIGLKSHLNKNQHQQNTI